MKQKGFALTDLLFAIGIFLFLAALSLGIYYIVNSKTKSAGETQNIALIVSQVSSLYANDGSYDGISSAVIVKSKGLPNNLVSGEKIINSWKKEITIEPVALDSVDNAGYAITTKGVTQTSCVAVANAFKTQALKIDINGTEISNLANGKAGTQASITTQCAAEKDNNTIKLIFQ